MDIKSRLMTTILKAPYHYYTAVAIAHALKPEAAQLLAQAEQSMVKQDVIKATDYYKQALERNGGSPFLALNLATLQAEQGLFDEGLEKLHEIAEQNQVASGMALYNMGSLLLSRGAFKPALDLLEKAYALDPHNAAVMNNLGIASLQNQQEDKARYYFLKALEEVPSYEPAAHNLGCIAYEHDDLAAAIEWFEKVLIMQPTNFVSLNNLGCTYYLNKQTDKAIDTLIKGIELNANYRMPYYNLGFIAYNEKLLKGAEA